MNIIHNIVNLKFHQGIRECLQIGQEAFTDAHVFMHF